MEIKFKALVKKVSSKALVSLDRSYEIILQGEDKEMAKLIDAPADELVAITVRYGENEISNRTKKTSK